jgi:hypothetical protein
LKESAKAGFLAAISDAVAQLGELGFHYRLEAVEGQETPKNGVLCSRCGGRGHNARGCKGGQKWAGSAAEAIRARNGSWRA